MRKPWQITLLEVVTCLSHAASSDSSDQASKELSLDRAIVRDIWKESQQSALDILQQHTIQDLCQQRQIQANADGAQTSGCVTEHLSLGSTTNLAFLSLDPVLGQTTSMTRKLA